MLLGVKQRGINPSVFNLLFKDLIETEKIKKYLDGLMNSVYSYKLLPDECDRYLFELTNQYLTPEMSLEDKVSVMRYITAFAKIENNVKATLRLMAVKQPILGESRHQESIHELYMQLQDHINRWASMCAVVNGLDQEWKDIPDLKGPD